MTRCVVLFLHSHSSIPFLLAAGGLTVRILSHITVYYSLLGRPPPSPPYYTATLLTLTGSTFLNCNSIYPAIRPLFDIWLLYKTGTLLVKLPIYPLPYTYCLLHTPLTNNSCNALIAFLFYTETDINTYYQFIYKLTL